MPLFKPMQVPSIILPTVWSLGTETETVANLLEHTSLEFSVDHLQEKMVFILATEIVVFGVPGNLNCWVELSPVLSTTSALYWAAIGGGGGARPPAAPTIEVAIGVNVTVHTILIPWSVHSPFARLVIQTPVAAAPATAFWVIQAIITGKG